MLTMVMMIKLVLTSFSVKLFLHKIFVIHLFSKICLLFKVNQEWGDQKCQHESVCLTPQDAPCTFNSLTHSEATCLAETSKKRKGEGGEKSWSKKVLGTIGFVKEVAGNHHLHHHLHHYLQHLLK